MHVLGARRVYSGTYVLWILGTKHDQGTLIFQVSLYDKALYAFWDNKCVDYAGVLIFRVSCTIPLPSSKLCMNLCV